MYNNMWPWTCDNSPPPSPPGDGGVGGCWRSFQWSAFRGSSARKGSLFRLRYKKGNGKMSFLVFGRVTKTLNNGEWCGITVFKGCENLKLRFGTIGRSLQVPLGDKPCLTGWGGDQTWESMQRFINIRFPFKRSAGEDPSRPYHHRRSSHWPPRPKCQPSRDLSSTAQYNWLVQRYGQQVTGRVHRDLWKIFTKTDVTCSFWRPNWTSRKAWHSCGSFSIANALKTFRATR